MCEGVRTVRYQSERESGLIGNRHAVRQAVLLHNGCSKKKKKNRPWLSSASRPARGQMAAEESEQAAALSHATPQQMHRLFIEK